MDTSKFKSISINDQVVRITQESARLRNALDAQRLPPGLIEELTTLESSLERISEQLVPFELQFSHLKALAGIGQVVNSTLEIDEVLQKVMDTIIRLTEAERGFLMLRDERGEMVIRIARKRGPALLNCSIYNLETRFNHRHSRGVQLVPSLCDDRLKPRDLISIRHVARARDRSRSRSKCARRLTAAGRGARRRRSNLRFRGRSRSRRSNSHTPGRDLF